MNILHLDSSIQGEASASRSLSAAVVERLRSAHPEAAISYYDLAATPIAHLTLDAFRKEEAEAILAEFLASNIVVIGAAFYNFTIPSQLKAWLDRLFVAGRTFRYVDGRPEGLAGGKRVIVALARGNMYHPGSPLSSSEHAETLLRDMFAFIGITAEFVIADGVDYSADGRLATIQRAVADVLTLPVDHPQLRQEA